MISREPLSVSKYHPSGMYSRICLVLVLTLTPPLHDLFQREIDLFQLSFFHILSQNSYAVNRVDRTPRLECLPWKTYPSKR
ncbi:Hypothetical protein FKW44_019754, partial [Caligus rogercresseyi]